MFGKKKESGIPVQHYEGIDQFSQDYSCRITVENDVIKIFRKKPETTVNLPINRITSIDEMEEAQFMAKYHGAALRTARNGKKYFLVIRYNTETDKHEKHLAFWGTAKERGKFIDLKMNLQKDLSVVDL